MPRANFWEAFGRLISGVEQMPLLPDPLSVPGYRNVILFEMCLLVWEILRRTVGVISTHLEPLTYNEQQKLIFLIVLFGPRVRPLRLPIA